MATRAEVERFRESNKSIVDLAKRELEAFWLTLDLSNPARARDEILEFMPILTRAYGEVAATIAADWYDDLRASADVSSAFQAVMAPVAPVDPLLKEARYQLGNLWADPAVALSSLSVTSSKYVLQPGRDTIAYSSERDPARVRWARVPSGSKTCAFCLLMASRGFSYTSEQTARGAKDYHGLCDCAPTPDWSDDPSLAGYDPDAMYDQYLEARKVAESTSTKDILAALRQEQGLS